MDENPTFPGNVPRYRSLINAGCELMADLGSTEKVVTAAKVAQLVTLIKENQLVTALVLFVLWQSGALLSAYSTAGGAICG